MLGSEMRKYLSPLGAASVLCITFVSSAIAGPVTKADLSGKTICWEGSHEGKATYLPSGKYMSTIIGPGSWKITPDGVEIDSVQGNRLDIINKLPDGTFSFYFGGGGGPNGITATGKYCK